MHVILFSLAFILKYNEQGKYRHNDSLCKLGQETPSPYFTSVKRIYMPFLIVGRIKHSE